MKNERGRRHRKRIIIFVKRSDIQMRTVRARPDVLADTCNGRRGLESEKRRLRFLLTLLLLLPLPPLLLWIGTSGRALGYLLDWRTRSVPVCRRFPRV